MNSMWIVLKMESGISS